jgi:hypothetical protein
MKWLILAVIIFILVSPVFIGRTKKTPAPSNAQNKYLPEFSSDHQEYNENKCMLYCSVTDGH